MNKVQIASKHLYPIVAKLNAINDTSNKLNILTLFAKAGFEKKTSTKFVKHFGGGKGVSIFIEFDLSNDKILYIRKYENRGWTTNYDTRKDITREQLIKYLEDECPAGDDD